MSANEIRPITEADSKTFGGVSSILPQNAEARSWMELTETERDVYLCGYTAGREAGWAAADRHAATLHAEAVRIVHAMAGIPARDRDADRDSAQRRASRFGQPLFGGPR